MDYFDDVNEPEIQLEDLREYEPDDREDNPFLSDKQEDEKDPEYWIEVSKYF